MEHKRIKVRLTKNSPYSDYGYYEKGDIGYIDGYVNGSAVIILENGKFAKSDLRWIEVVNEEDDEQKPAWSEEDEEIIEALISLCDGAQDNIPQLSALKNWLKSLKDRVQPQPKQVLRDTFGYEDGRLFGMNEGIGLVLDNPEKYGLQKPVKWREEDEDIINKILCICNDFKRSFEISPASTKVIQKDIDKIDSWLKSLRPQSHWKPSDEQMKALEESIMFLGTSWVSTRQFALESLYQELKKLMEE